MCIYTKTNVVQSISIVVSGKAVASGMGVKHMNDMDTVTFELETDINDQSFSPSAQS